MSARAGSPTWLKNWRTAHQVGDALNWVIAGVVYQCKREPGACPFCGIPAVVALPPPELAKQPDDTTHVCHPSIGGCNTGFSMPKEGAQ